MATEQYFHESVVRNDYNKQYGTSLEKWKSVSAAFGGSENNPANSFDCNICLDVVLDPVVTLCGHLYCWPCIYKWIHYLSVSAENSDQQQPQCPVCKAEVSQKTLVPLYGRGQTTKPSESKVQHLGIVIPQRPPSPRCGFYTPITTTPTTNSRPAQQLHHRGYTQQPQLYYPHHGSYAATPIQSPGGTASRNVSHQMTGMFGEMIYARIFGSAETTLYTYPNTYDLAGSSSPRVRRYVMQADKSLSRVCFFLCCCIILCLFLF